MMHIRKINPMVRAVGTMGAVAAVAGGITFAALTSNTVALSGNTLSTATAHLLIGSGNGTNCANAGTTNVTGMDLKLVPGQKSQDFNFCLKNDGGVNLVLTSSVLQNALIDSPIHAGDVTLNMTCNNGGSVSDTLSAFTSKPLGTLKAGATTDCKANAMLNSGFSGTGTKVNPFEIDFVGTQATSTGGSETPSSDSDTSGTTGATGGSSTTPTSETTEGSSANL